MSKTQNVYIQKQKIFIVIAVIIIAAAIFLSQAANPPKKTFSDVVDEHSFSRESDTLYDYEINRYPSSAVIGDTVSGNALIGFDVDPTKLNFGTIPANGSYSRKVINLTGVADKKARVYIEARGDIKPFVNISKSDFVMDNGDKEEIEVFFYTINNGLYADVRTYTGEIHVVVQVPKYDFVYGLWGQ